MKEKSFKYKQPDIKYRDEYYFNQGRDAFNKNPDAMCPYQRWQQERRDDWMAGYLYELRLHNQKLASDNN